MTCLQNRASNFFYIKFYPELQAFTGCTMSTLIIEKLEYWFSKPRYVGGFYKFVEPCGHPLYRAGDSWSEELGVSRKLFAKAFDIIGVRYNSKSSYLAAEDKFQGKLYASYHDRKTNRTYFVRNHEFTSQILEKIKAPYSSVKQKTKKSKEPTLKKDSSRELPLEKLPPKLAHPSVSHGRSRNGDSGRSYARGSFSLHKKTSSLERKISKSSPPDSQMKDEAEEMIEIWKEEVGELGVSSFSNGLLQKLQNTLIDFFDQSMESWKSYCQMISSSKFLMGEAQNKFFKKAWIIWAIKSENIERIKGGGFKLGDRRTNQDKEIEAVDIEIQSVEYKKHQIEMKISSIKTEEHKKRKKIVKDEISNLSEQERLSLEKDFERHLEQENNSMTEEFRKYRWNGVFVSVYFYSFVEEKIYSKLFGKSEEVHDEKVVQSSGLLELLDNVRHALDQLKKKKEALL